MLDKVRKLLIKAEDPACPAAEAEALTAKATELIAKYGLDQALLDAAAPEPARVGDRKIVLDAPYAREKAHLLHVVARSLRCRTVSLHSRGPDGARLAVHLFGFTSDLDGVELLFASLLIQAARALAAAPPPVGAQPAAWRRSWYVGFASAVAARFVAMERRADAEPDRVAGAGALVLADRADAVDRAVTEQYPSLVRGRPRRLSGGGFHEGNAAGNRADLGGTRMTSAERPGLPA